MLALAVLAVAGAVGALAGAGRLARADFVLVSGGDVSSLDPQAATGIPEGRVLRMLYEGLVGRDPSSLEPVPAAARAWDVSPSGLDYLFFLRRDARWSNGDPVTAQDFVWSLRRLLEPESAAPYAYELWCVTGARAYNTGRDAQGREVPRDWAGVGIRALDPHTLELQLERPAPHLLDLLAFQAFFPLHGGSLEALRERYPRTWRTRWARPDELVVNGPFTLAARRLGDRMRLARNPHYWDADAVAFDTIDVLSITHAGTAVNMYLTGEVDWVDGLIPPHAVPRLIGREDFLRAPYLGVYFFRVNTTKPPLDDVRVRRALSLTLPRKAICEWVLKAGQQPATTMVPWGRLGDYRSPETFEENLDEARGLLEQAGFGPEGEPFPTLELHYNTSEAHRDIAEVVAATWKQQLGIDVRLANQEWKVYLDAQASLAYDVSRSSWIADYPDPLGFLKIFASGSENNRTGWSDARFDELIAAAEREGDQERRNELIAEAEARLFEEMPVLPLYSYVTQNLVAPRLGGFEPNVLNEHSPKAWYWMDDAELAALRASGARPGRPVHAFGPRAGKRSPAARRAREAPGEDAPTPEAPR